MGAIAFVAVLAFFALAPVGLIATFLVCLIVAWVLLVGRVQTGIWKTQDETHAIYEALHERFEASRRAQPYPPPD